MINSGSNIKKTISLIIIGTIFLNMFFFINPSKTQAADCNYTTGVDYNLSKKNDGPQADQKLSTENLLRPRNLKIIEDPNSDKVQISFDRPQSAPQGTFWASYLDPYIEGGDTGTKLYYKYTGNMYLIIDGNRYPINYSTAPSVGSPTNITLERNIPKDGKEHKFQIVVDYTRGEKCKNGLWGDFNDLKVTQFTTISNEEKLLRSKPGESNKCDELKSRIESKLCAVVRCMRELAKDPKFWKINQPNDIDAFLYTISSGNYNVEYKNLTYEGQLQIRQCGKLTGELNELTNQITSNPDCKKTIIDIKKDCTFGEKTDLKYPVDSSSEFDLSDYMKKILKIETKLHEEITKDMYGASSTQCSETCKGLQKPYNYVCESVCWIGVAFMKLPQCSFLILQGAISIETSTEIAPIKFYECLTGKKDTSSTTTPGTTPSPGGSTPAPTTTTDNPGSGIVVTKCLDDCYATYQQDYSGCPPKDVGCHTQVEADFKTCQESCI